MNRDSPQAPGVLWYPFNGSLWNVGGLTYPQPSLTATSWAVSTYGRVLRATAGNQCVQWPDASVILPTAEVTIAIAYRKTDATLRNSGGFGVNDTLAQRCGTHLPYSDGVVYWDFGGATSGVDRLQVGGLSFGDDVWVFTAGPRGMEIWQNGLLRASQPGAASRTSSTTPFYILGGQAFSDEAEVADFKLYRTQRPQPLCAHLSHPRTRWDLYAIRSTRVFFDMAAAATGKAFPVFGNRYRPQFYSRRAS